MAQESQIPQQLMTAALLHFEKGVPIDDCDVKGRGHRERLARVHHVYFQWIRNPLIDTFEMFRLLLNGQCSDRHSLYRMAQRDNILFEFVKDHIAISSRKQDEAMVRAAANQAIRIGMETDNVNALTKGGKLLYEVAHLGEPEEDRADMNKLSFLPPVVTTSAKEVDETKDDMDDAEMKRIMAKYNGYVDEKERDIDRMVEVMEAKSEARPDADATGTVAEEVSTYGHIEEVRDDKPLTVISVEKDASHE